MKVGDGMSTEVLFVGPEHTLEQAAAMMAERNIGSAVVIDPDRSGPGILTERDLLRVIAAGKVPAQEIVADHLTEVAWVASDHGELDDAAETMVQHGFRHLVVVDDASDVVGMLSMRDVVRCWVTNNERAARA